MPRIYGDQLPISLLETHALLALCRQPCRATEIGWAVMEQSASVVTLTPNATHALVTRLEKAGYIGRPITLDGRRALRYELTDKGRQRFATSLGAYRRLLLITHG